MIPVAEKRLVSLMQLSQTGSVVMSMWKKMLGGVTRESEAAAFEWYGRWVRAVYKQRKNENK